MSNLVTIIWPLLCYFQRCLPRLEEQVEEKLAQTQAEMERYGTGPPSDPAERLIFLIDVRASSCFLITQILTASISEQLVNSCFCCHAWILESNSIHSGCHESGCRRGTQMWRPSQCLFYAQKRVREVEHPPGPSGAKLWVFYFCLVYSCPSAGLRNKYLLLMCQS